MSPSLPTVPGVLVCGSMSRLATLPVAGRPEDLQACHSGDPTSRSLSCQPAPSTHTYCRTQVPWGWACSRPSVLGRERGSELPVNSPRLAVIVPSQTTSPQRGRARQHFVKCAPPRPCTLPPNTCHGAHCLCIGLCLKGSKPLVFHLSPPYCPLSKGSQ